VSVGGAICLGSFILWTMFSLIVFMAYGNIYDFLQSIWCVIIVIIYIIILVFYRIGKRMADKYG